MAKLSFSNFKKYFKTGSTTDTIGINLSAPVVNSLGHDGFYSTLANQITWGEDAEILGQTLKGETTEDLFTAIEDGVSYYISSATIDTEQISNAISSYLETNSVIPTLTGGGTAESGYYISGISLSGHTIRPVYSNLPTAPVLSVGESQYSDSASETGYYCVGITVSGHTISPKYAKLEEYAHPTAAQMWADYNG